MIGKLFLIPSFLGTDNPNEVFPAYNYEMVRNMKHFIVEDERTARRFLKKLVPEIIINDLNFSLLNEHTKPEEIINFLNPCKDENMGLISDAGVPCVADPGAIIVQMAHQKGIEVIPLIGPSSILLALMGSGLNGQSFAFNGYLPTDKNERVQKIKLYEKRSMNESQTQIFIETPYRNQALLADLIATLQPTTRLCVACNLTDADEFIATLPAQEWLKKMPEIHKRPAIFLFLSA